MALASAFSRVSRRIIRESVKKRFGVAAK